MENKINNNQEEFSDNNEIVENNFNENTAKDKKINNILIIVGIVLPALFFAIFVYWFYLRSDIFVLDFDQNIEKRLDIDQNVKNQPNFSFCDKDDDCCNESLEIVTKEGYQIIKVDEDCSEGFEKNGLWCMSSLFWCEPVRSVRDMTIKEIKYPKNTGKGVALKLNIDDEGVKMMKDYELFGGYPNYYPGTYEFIAEVVAADDVILGEYGFRDPRMVQAEMGYDGPSLLDSADITLIIPYFENFEKIKIYHKGYLMLTVENASNNLDNKRSGTEMDNIISECGELKFSDSRDSCLFEYAMSRKIIGLCDDIIDIDVRKQCIAIFVPSETSVPVLGTLNSDPDAIKVNVGEFVTFTVMQSGSEVRAEKVILEELNEQGEVMVEFGELKDSGENGDLMSEDHVYSASFRMRSVSEGVLNFRVKAYYADMGAPIYSDVYKFYVTRFPVGFYASDMSKVVFSPETGEKIISNEVLVSFYEGTEPDVIEKIVSEVNGEVVGVTLSLGVYQVKISDSSGYSDVFKTIEKLQTYDEVKFAEPNAVVGIDSF